MVPNRMITCFALLSVPPRDLLPLLGVSSLLFASFSFSACWYTFLSMPTFPCSSVFPNGHIELNGNCRFLKLPISRLNVVNPVDLCTVELHLAGNRTNVAFLVDTMFVGYAKYCWSFCVVHFPGGNKVCESSSSSQSYSSAIGHPSKFLPWSKWMRSGILHKHFPNENFGCYCCLISRDKFWKYVCKDQMFSLPSIDFSISVNSLATILGFVAEGCIIGSRIWKRGNLAILHLSQALPYSLMMECIPVH